MPIPLKLLLVEDDLLDAELNIVNLEAEGFACEWQRVQTEKDLRALLKAEKFDIILIDYNLPGFDGLKALQIVADCQLDIPLIFVTGNLEMELAIDSLKAGATDFVHKDRITRLGASVRRALEEFSLRRADRRKRAELNIFRTLNNVANQGATLEELANTLADVLSAALQSNDITVHLRSSDGNSLEIYNIRHNLQRIERLEKMLGISVPSLKISLEKDNIYTDVLREKKVRVLDSPKSILSLYSLYLEVAHFPEALHKRIDGLLLKLASFMGIEKVIVFPLVAEDQAIGLLEVSYQDRRDGYDDFERISEMLGQITAIFVRKKLEEEVGKLHDRQKMILDSAAEGIMGMDMEGKHIFVNPAAAQILGYTVSELLYQNHTLYHLPKTSNGKSDGHECPLFTPGNGIETVFVRKDGTSFPVSYTSSNIIRDDEAIGVVFSFRDITEQVESTRELARLGQVVDQAQVSVGITDLEGNLIYVNPFFEEVSGYSKEEMLLRNPRILKSGLQSEAVYEELWETITSGATWHGKLINRNKDGDFYHDDAIIFPIKTSEGETINYATVKREISAEVEAQKRIERQLSRLEALHLIDVTILSGVDLPQTIDVVLSKAMDELQLDAIDLLLFDSDLQSFSCISRFGFNTEALAFTNLRLGEGLAGRAAMSREVVHVDDLKELQGAPQIKDEKFLSYYGVPLIAKGELKGVIEVFLRKEFTPDDEWLNYLNAIAGQAAIAIENDRLFSDLIKKNDELRLAYEATLKGWARGLELHDMETEGHSRRVVDMTVSLARRMGVDEDQLVHIRRGALLHDIGKLAIPERILNKKGPFDPEEKALMQKHTIYGHEMLADIPFLKPALDIPRSHHEKWDGSGYPLGLSGTEIPLSARIFAIIDVYDALGYDRPYRKAWDRETVLDYLQGESGTHFDPDVVQAFFDEFVYQKKDV